MKPDRVRPCSCGRHRRRCVIDCFPGSRNMFCARRQVHPRMLVVLIHGSHRMWKCWIGKCAQRDGNHIFLRFHVVMNGCPAVAAEVKCCLHPRVADTHKGRGTASDLDVDSAKARLRAKCTSGSALTGQAMANRNSNWIAGCGGGQLTATTGRCSGDHCPCSHARSPRSLTDRRLPEFDLVSFGVNDPGKFSVFGIVNLV